MAKKNKKSNKKKKSSKKKAGKKRKTSKKKSSKKKSSKKKKRTSKKKTSKKKKKTTKKKTSKKKKKRTSKKKSKKTKKKNQDRIVATGKRKSAIARVWLLTSGKGEIDVNGKKVKDFFPTLETQKQVIAPLKVLKKEKSFDVVVKLKGGGFRGQAEATQLGIARALEKFNSDWRKKLKENGFLSRDARVKERKKPGLKRARRAPQWRKR